MDGRKTRPGEAARAALEKAVALRFNHLGEFTEELSANISAGGMFIRTDRPPPVGSVFEFEMRLDDARPPIAGKAQIAWVRRRSERLDRPVGIGVRFVELEDESRRRVGALVAATGLEPETAPGGEPTSAELPAAGADGEDAEPAEQEATALPEPAPEPRPAPLLPAARGAFSAATSSDRKRRRGRWTLLAAAVVLALAAALWLRPAFDGPGAATPLPAEPQPAEPQPAEPQPAEPAPAPDGADQQPEQLRLIDDWARSWSEQRVDDYLAAYSPRFAPEGGLDRGAWERRRRARILAPRWIEVGIAFAELEETAGGRSQVRFVQAYESDSYRDVVRKLLVLERESDGWKIVRETIEP